MAGSLTTTPERCEVKRTYQSRRTAKLDARRIRHNSGFRLRAYRCPACGEFHLTSWPYKGHAAGEKPSD